jgi:disintegrin and metalloproteinase domain-containing protein 10
VCEKIGSGWSACSLSAPTDDKNFNRGQLCYVSCWNAATATCVSTGNSQDVNKPENKVLLDFLVLQTARDGIQLPPGAPCDNFKGYCDVFQKCRAVNEDGPLARLKNLLFNQQTFNDIKAWITEHWWAVLLMSLALVVFMALFIKICAVHTPSSNPKQPPARKLTLPRRHAHRPQGQNQPPPYSSAQPIQLQSMPAGGPPHGKRRGGRPPASSSSQAAQSSGQARHFTDVGMAGGGKRGGGHGHRQMQQV